MGRRLGAALVALLAVLPAVPAAAAPAGERSWSSSAGYVDTCHDALDSPLDLRSVAVDQLSTRRTWVVELGACGTWSGEDLGTGGELRVAVAPGPDPSAPADRWVVVRGDGLGGLVAQVERRVSGALQVVHTGAVARPDDATVVVEVPWSALDVPDSWHFVVSTLDADERSDRVPETYAGALSWPFDCTVQTARAATVVVEPGRGAQVLAAARGLRVRDGEGRVLRLAGVSDAALDALRRTPGVVSAERPALLHRAEVPDDPGYLQQWSLPAVSVPQAWEQRAASGLLLAVVDDGVDGTRADLEDLVVRGRDTLYDVPLPPDSDLGGHGTAVAGLAAAATGNGTELAGVDQGAQVVPYRVFDAAGCAEDAAVAEALYAAADRGASVVNVSLGGPADTEVLRRAVLDVTARGVLVVAAAGNGRQTGNHLSYPAAYDEVVAVGATTRQGVLASYSSTGPHLDLVAPGGDGSGTVDGDLLVLGERGGLTAAAGTSFATPLVSAAALLFRAENPHASPAQVTAALRRSARDAGVPGHDAEYGAGLLDVAALLAVPVPEPRSSALACPAGAVPEDGLADADASVHEASIDCAVWWGVTTGVAGGGYAPGLDVDRAQMASFLARLLQASGMALPADPPDAFHDDEGSVHEPAIDALAALGVLRGSEGRAEPGALVTRAQMATFLVRAYALRTGQSVPPAPDHFADDDASAHAASIDQAAELGLTTGTPDGRYLPERSVARDAMATFLVRLLDRLVEEGDAAPPSA